ncbi:MAG: phosphoglucosamine mutase [Blastocatellia bacterium]|jgi:phosphoglucosamine mutase|nr:phosphoglucosamine mutase [Blastocatellia bacterium]
MRRLFGTDGIRGKAGDFPLDPVTVRRIGRSLARHLRTGAGGRAPFILAGRDTRESGEWIERALLQGAAEEGARSQSAGVITTPGVAFLTRSRGADAGVVISASHNPYEDNGIKIFEPSGRKLSDAVERLIELDVVDAKKGGSESQPVPATQRDTDSLSEERAPKLRDEYRRYLLEEIAGDLSLNGLSLVIDCANGAASEIAPPLFQALGAKVLTIHNSPDGKNINKDCGSLHLDGLRERVLQEQADLGVAFDGDADRALFVDSSGDFVDGDATLWILAKHLQANGGLNGDLVVATVMSNIGLEIALNAAGISLLRTDVGDKYVLEELTRTGASIGGEQSGHIIFPAVSLAGDGIATTLCLLRAVGDSRRTVADLTKGFVRYPQILVNVKVVEKPSFADLPEVARLALETQTRLGSKGRLLLRYSGTESLARVMIEGESQSEIKSYAQALALAIEDAIGAR